MLGCVNQYFGPFQCVLDHFSHQRDIFWIQDESHSHVCVLWRKKNKVV